MGYCKPFEMIQALSRKDVSFLMRIALSIIIVLGSAVYGLGFSSVSTSLIPPMSGTYHYNNFKPGSSGFPAAGESYVDPVFGTTVTRLTNIGSAASDEQIYARNGYHNANSSRMFSWGSGGLRVIDSHTGAVLFTSQPTGLKAYEVSFDPVDPDVYYRFSGSSLIARKLSTQTDTTIHTFPGTLSDLGGTTDFIDNSGRYFVIAYSGTAHIYDKETDTVYANSITPFGSGGWLGITPSGKYLVNQAGPGSYPQKEHYSYYIDHTTKTLTKVPTQFVGLTGDHGDLMSPSDGKDYEVKFNSDISPPGLYLFDLSTNMSGKTATQQIALARPLVTTSSYYDADGHLSCVSKGALRDWCFWSSENPSDTFNSNPTSAWSNYRQEIIMVNVVSGEVRRLAHHRSRSVANYSSMPRICVSWDGSVAAFASNFNLSSPQGYVDLYAILFSSSPSADEVPPATPTNLQIK